MCLKYAALIAGLALGQMSGIANAATVSFTLKGDSSSPGTVSGLLGGLSDNAINQRATFVEITSSPDGLKDYFITPSLNNNFFDIENGKVLASEFDASINGVRLTFNVYDQDFYTNGQTGITVSGPRGSTTFQVSNVPLPASAPMFGASLLGFAGLGYVAKRKRSSAAA